MVWLKRMKKHTKIYMEALGFAPGDFIPCECCGRQAQDVHHIHARGMGGDPQGKRDTIENLMAVCRYCHTVFESKKVSKDKQVEIHKNYLICNLQ